MIEVTMTVALCDAQATHARAAATGAPALAETIGAAGAPDLAGCVGAIVRAALPSDDAFALVDVRTGRTGPLRVVPMVAASISNLTEAEMDRIRAAFRMEAHGDTHMALEDVTHDGLWMSPKDHGFYVRLPALSEGWDRVLPGLTPEMRAIAELARAQGADRIEFDADEDPADGLTDHHS